MDMMSYLMGKQSGGGSLPFDIVADGNITEIDGKKVLTPLGAGIIKTPVNIQFSAISNMEQQPSYIFEEYLPIQVGDKFEVTVDGVTEEHEVRKLLPDEEDSPIIFGTMDPFNPQIGDWMIMSNQFEQVTFCLVLDTGKTYDFSVVGSASEIKKIDEKFLPNSTIPLAPFTLRPIGGRLFQLTYTQNGSLVSFEDFDSYLNYVGSINSPIFYVTNFPHPYILQDNGFVYVECPLGFNKICSYKLFIDEDASVEQGGIVFGEDYKYANLTFIDG